jgi:hypothetical protein
MSELEAPSALVSMQIPLCYAPVPGGDLQELPDFGPDLATQFAALGRGA